jgi:hypothetical protein
VSITCVELLADGSGTSNNTTTISIMGSLGEGTPLDVSTCPRGLVVRAFDTRTGAGFDAIRPVCATPDCR